MTISLDNRVALVGGATSGIGWAISTALAQAGATIIAVARDQERLRFRLDQLRTMTGREHAAIMANYDNPTSPASIASELTRLSLAPDIVVNNSGGPPPGPIVDARTDDFRRAFDRLVLTTHSLLQVLLPHMKEQRWGRIVNIISTSVRQPIEGLGVSNTIRAATAAWAKTMSFELAPYGITVNSILPGATRTERLDSLIVSRAAERGVAPSIVEEELLAEIPMKRFAHPNEIAAVAVFLCSDYAGYITGECIRVDGGRTRCL